MLIKPVKKRRFCGGRATRFGVPRTQSSSRCSCHLLHPACLHFANWNARQRRRCNTSGPMRNAIFRSCKLWLDVFCVCAWACKCNASGRNSEKELGTICYRNNRSCNARKPSARVWACRPDHRQIARKAVAKRFRIAYFDRYDVRIYAAQRS